MTDKQRKQIEIDAEKARESSPLLFMDSEEEQELYKADLDIAFRKGVKTGISLSDKRVKELEDALMESKSLIGRMFRDNANFSSPDFFSEVLNLENRIDGLLTPNENGNNKARN